jgi:hypothetical protein
MARPQHNDQLIARLAEEQHGIVARRQLTERGVPEHLLDDRVKARRLLVLRRGVYALAHRALRPEAHWLAAVLACGEEAVLSHHSAAVHWGIAERVPAKVHVIAEVSRKRGVHPHRMALDPTERTTHRGIPITTVARTILDLAATTRGRKLEMVIRRAARARRFDLTELRATIDRHPRHPGRKPLNLLLADLHGRGTDDFRSDLEVLLAQISDDLSQPRPVINGHVEDIRVDFHWPHARLIVETDGFDFHAMPTQFEQDRANDQTLTVAGWRVIRVTKRQAPTIGETIAGLLCKIPCKGKGSAGIR